MPNMIDAMNITAGGEADAELTEQVRAEVRRLDAATDEPAIFKFDPRCQVLTEWLTMTPQQKIEAFDLQRAGFIKQLEQQRDEASEKLANLDQTRDERLAQVDRDARELLLMSLEVVRRSGRYTITEREPC